MIASRMIISTFGKKIRQFHVAHKTSVLLRPILFTNQANFLHVKRYDKDLRVGDPLAQVIDTPTQTKKFKEVFNSTNPDVFGDAEIEETPPDPGDVMEDEYIQNPPRHSKILRTKEYAVIIKDHLNNHRLKEAINVLEVKMLKEDRAKPDEYIYSLLISGCAKAGYTKKAFQLFNKMKQRGLKVKGGTYTSLFNACASAPTIADGLTKANYLRELMLEKGYEPNITNYNAMIKAYGRCGDTKTSYMLADEMLDKKLKVNTETFNFLLQACASDKRYGFRHALLTWHRMHKNRISPDYYSFNLMLRCVRDTNIGDVETMEKVLSLIFGESKKINAAASAERLQIAASTNEGVTSEIPENSIPKNKDNEDLLEEKNKEKIDESEVAIKSKETTSNPFEKRIADLPRPEFDTPNLLTKAPLLGSLLSIAEVKEPHDRLLLLGGFSGYLQEMKKYGITPGIETFTTLLEVIPPTNAAEKQLITMIRKIGLKTDIDFFNILIKKRSMRFDYEGAKEVLTMIQTAGLYPDIVTYGVLALGCKTQEEARELIAEMRSKDIRMNAQILGAMLRQGCVQMAFPYVSEIMQIGLDENVPPNEIFLRHLDNFYKKCANLIDIRHISTKSKLFRKQHAKFCSKYRTWQEEHGIGGMKVEEAIKKIKKRPYQQFVEDTEDGFEQVKNEKLSKKSKLRKYIKKIKVENLKGDEESQSSQNRVNSHISPPKVIEPA